MTVPGRPAAGGAAPTDPLYAPLIVTAELPADVMAWADGLRRAHFPPERNQVRAHVTLFHALPPAGIADPFELGMRAVESAHIALAQALAGGAIHSMAAIAQDKSAEIRYSRYSDFTDEVVAHYLAHPPQPDAITQSLRQPPRPGIRLTAGARSASSQH